MFNIFNLFSKKPENINQPVVEQKIESLLRITLIDGTRLEYSFWDKNDMLKYLMWIENLKTNGHNYMTASNTNDGYTYDVLNYEKVLKVSLYIPKEWKEDFNQAMVKLKESIDEKYSDEEKLENEEAPE